MHGSGSESGMSSVAARWAEVLRNGGYEISVESMHHVRRLRRLSRTWRCILAETGLRPPAFVFEVGCGGGGQLIPLALNGFVCCGVDASAAVLARLRRAAGAVSSLHGCNLPLEVVEADFLTYRPTQSEEYDLVFHFGVLEHYLAERERLQMLEKMVSLCRPGGFVVSVVPSGVHPLRELQRTMGLGGYYVPEVDYHPPLILAEFRMVGAEPVIIRCHDVFGYLRMDPAAGRVRRLLNTVIYLAAQVAAPTKGPLATRHAGSFIGIAKRPLKGS